MKFLKPSYWEQRFPPKGSLNWVVKMCSQLQKYQYTILIRDGKSSIGMPQVEIENPIPFGTKMVFTEESTVD